MDVSRKVFRFVKEECGQSVAMVAITAAVLFGSAALAVDLGQGYSQKQKMQNAADLAAEAAANYLSVMDSGASDAIEAAYEYAERNGVAREDVTVTTPYNGDPLLIEVVCRHKLTPLFSKAIDAESGYAAGRAVARKENVWVGEALPFVNLDGPYWNNSYSNSAGTGAKLQIWDKNNNNSNPLPGNFDRISDKDDGKSNWKKESSKYSKDYYTVDYSDGITVVNGRRAYIKDHIQKLYNEHSTIYLFSLSQEVIEARKYNRTTLGNKTTIPLEDLVLLQVDLVAYNQKGSDKYMIVQVKEIYDINNGEFPTTFLRGGITTSLVE